MINSRKSSTIIISTDSFKGSLSAHQACTIISKAFSDSLKDEYNINVNPVPLSDGGEGLIDVIKDHIDGEINSAIVSDALGNKIEVDYLIYCSDNTKTAILEMASVVGLYMLDESEKNPMNTSTFGFGELILDALDKEVSNFVIGIGGTSTNDGGFGMLKALGVRFLENGVVLEGNSPSSMFGLTGIDVSSIDSRLCDSSFVVACDVNNPFCGDLGASRVFAEQKGADLNCVEDLDSILSNFALVIKKFLGRDIINEPGSGAGGGVGGTLLAFLDAELKSGIKAIMDITGFSELVESADIVITGEGKTDAQTLNGKVVLGVTDLATFHNKRVIILSGSLGDGYEYLENLGLVEVFAADSYGDAGDNFERADKVLYDAAFIIAKLVYP